MATSVVVGEESIQLKLPAEVLGPGSPYEERRIALRKDWEPIVEAAKKMEVVDAESCEEATKLGRLLQASGKEVDSFYKPIKSQIDAIKKPVLDAERVDLAAINEQKVALGSKITKFNDAQRRQREEQERIAREALEKAEREAAIQRAIDLEAAGELQQAEAVLEETVHAPAVIIQHSTPFRTAGQVAKETYSCEIVDPKAVLKAVLDGRLPMAAITINLGWLNSKASLEKEAFAVPGCKLVKKASTHFRA